MKVSTDSSHAVEFLRWLFGDEPDGFIYVLRTKTNPDPADARQGKLVTNPVTFSRPEKIDSSWWAEQSHLWSQTFATTTLTNRDNNNEAANTKTIPALWCDIDGCKELGIPGEEFYSELRNTENVSAFIRSSINGIQMFWKLDTPYLVNGDKDNFTNDLAGLLYDICLYYGGDGKVVTLGRLMRLPGSLNLKPEYSTDDQFMASARINDAIFSLEDLKRRFTPNPDVVPKLVLYACTRALTTIWETGERHDIILRLAGSARKHGINKEACRRLCKEVQTYFGDTEDRSADIDSTYSTDLDSVMTLHTDYYVIAEDVEKAIDFWTKLKKFYCKKRGFDFFPENENPTEPEPLETTFYERNLQTYFHGQEADEEFCNFVIKLKGRIIKADTLASVWLAEIHMTGEFPTLVEISTEKHSQWHKFLTITGLPVGISVKNPRMWAEYVAYLQTTCPDLIVKESTYYGWLDVGKNKPTLLLPSVPHTDYIWTGLEDTAAKPNILIQDLSKKDIINYLTKFAESYTTYHEPRFIWTSLGWFASCAVKELIRYKLKGFPTLMVCGLAGSGKSWLIRDVLSMHYGCQNSHSFAGTTSFAIRKRLTSNNVCPLIVDEYRDLWERRTAETLEMIRSLFDGYQSSQGRATGTLLKETFQTPLCLVGEHHYTDEASVQRSLIITLNRSWLNHLHATSTQEQEELTKKRSWLHNLKYQGWLGTILIKWVSENINEVYNIIDIAKKIVDDTCPTTVDRKRVGCAAVITGHLILAQIYKSYGLVYPLRKQEMLDALYASDVTLNIEQNYDTDTLQHLFEITDSVIISGHRMRATHEGTLYAFDIENKQYIYFDLIRWHRSIKPNIKVSESATLTDKDAFASLIQDHQKQKDSPFIEVADGTPVFEHCVKVDLNRVKTMFKINIEQWRGINEFQDI